MASNSSQRILQSMGLQPRPDYSRFNATIPRHSGDLDQMRRRAHSEGPGSLAWDEYHAILQHGLDEELSDTAAFNGAVPRSIDDQYNDLIDAKEQQSQFWLKDRAHPLLFRITDNNGVALVDQPAENAHTLAASLMADGHHNEARLLQQAIDSSYSSSIGATWEINDHGEQGAQWQVQTPQSIETTSADAYTNWRRSAFAERTGLDAMTIGNSGTAEESMLAGLSNFSAGGGTYDAFNDPVVRQYRQQQSDSFGTANDMNNSFPVEV